MMKVQYSANRSVWRDTYIKGYHQYMRPNSNSVPIHLGTTYRITLKTLWHTFKDFITQRCYYDKRFTLSYPATYHDNR